MKKLHITTQKQQILRAQQLIRRWDRANIAMHVLDMAGTRCGYKQRNAGCWICGTRTEPDSGTDQDRAETQKAPSAVYSRVAPLGFTGKVTSWSTVQILRMRDEGMSMNKIAIALNAAKTPTSLVESAGREPFTRF